MTRDLVINIVVGFAIAAFISVLLILALRIFYPAPAAVLPPDYSRCATGDQVCIERENREVEGKQAEYNAAKKIYDERALWIYNGAGVLFILAGYLLLRRGFALNLVLGIIFAGAFAIFYAANYL